MHDWYPARVKVGPEGTPATYKYLSTCFGPDSEFVYAEFGIYLADTARNVCERFPRAELHLFDYTAFIAKAREKLGAHSARIHYHENSQRFNDSYNWSLMRILADRKGEPLFDYCFLDGAHTVAIDGLAFFLCDRLLKVGGHIDFDDYGWRMRGSSLDPSSVPEIASQYTEEQIDAYQVRLIVDHLVRTDPRYVEVVPNKVFRKTW